MPFTLDKLKEVRTKLDNGDVLGACKPLNELIDRWTQMQNEWEFKDGKLIRKELEN